jgi:hypothetical protein
MSRYRTRSYVADDCAWDEKVAPKAMEVIEGDAMVNTGLLDQDGNRLYRQKLPIGFTSKH